jgi:hypothetical protein
MVLTGENGGTRRETCANASLSPQIPCEFLGLNVVLCTVRPGDKLPGGIAHTATRR